MKLTVFERLFSRIRIPYTAGCLILAILLGPFGSILVGFVQRVDIAAGVSDAFSLYFNQQVEIGQGLIGLFLLTCLLFYALYIGRFMRQKLVEAKDPLLPLLQSEEVYNQAFSGVFNPLPPLGISIVLLLLFLTQSFDSFMAYCSNLAYTVFFVAAYSLFFIAFFNFVWIYFSSIIGLHFLGKKFMKLKSFTEDRMLGVKPIGSLSLSLVFAYFAGISILILLPGSFATMPGRMYLAYLAGLILFGMASFILPLFTTHLKMVESKKLEQENLRQELLKRASNTSREEGSSSKEMKEAIDQLTAVFSLNLKRDEVLSIPTWPIDISILGRLVITVLFPITATIAANYLMRQVLHMF